MHWQPVLLSIDMMLLLMLPPCYLCRCADASSAAADCAAVRLPPLS